MNKTQARFILGIALPMSMAALAVVPYLLLRGDLPSRLATHFDGSGTPDGSMTQGAFLLFTLAMVAAGGAVCVWLARTTKPFPASVAPTAGFLGGFFTGLGGGIAAVTFFQQRGLDNWTEADDILVLVLAPLVFSVFAGALAARAAAVLPVASYSPDADAQPRMDLAPGQHAVWAETMHSTGLAWLGVAVTTVGVVVGIGTAWWLVLTTLLVGVIMISLATLHVRADRSGLHVKYGLLPWPRTNVGVADIETASVIDVRPMQWGGWGYRGSLKLMKQAAVVHRAGPGIRLDLRGGKVFVVTVDDPATPVALLNAEVARSTQPA